ncbi:hypothetical protein PS627_03585 [Pseudomonas fluorescens]|uniref:RHS repeat-associated core domain-containing protein n=1 Tax=Pseudomonas fluorescens TaxID=294 RepID=UPI0012546C35|nr:RHS repeat-associated core domain-containing protein [Pseudomonas fluorescens]CAG8869570.1 hypothetical protein PS627_03585 [Pseudomonas fluorescens]VVP98797.1 hypothetical protein PS910_03601 [Pseudomonas fluorescens]
MKIKNSKVLYFYQNGELSTASTEKRTQTFVRHNRYTLAEKLEETGICENRLVAIDGQGSILNSRGSVDSKIHSYTAFGYDPDGPESFPDLGFAGQLRDSAGLYVLGKGYRAYQPTLMRFHSPDSFSPFGQGGINPYSYCEGDPANYSDPTGHMRAVAPVPGRTAPPPNYSEAMKGRLPSYKAASAAPPGYDTAIARMAGQKAISKDRAIPTAESVFRNPTESVHAPSAPMLEAYAPSAPVFEPRAPSAPAFDPYSPSAPPLAHQLNGVASTYTAPSAPPALAISRNRQLRIDQLTSRMDILRSDIRTLERDGRFHARLQRQELQQLSDRTYRLYHTPSGQRSRR